MFRILGVLLLFVSVNSFASDIDILQQDYRCDLVKKGRSIYSEVSTFEIRNYKIDGVIAVHKFDARFTKAKSFRFTLFLRRDDRSDTGFVIGLRPHLKGESYDQSGLIDYYDSERVFNWGESKYTFKLTDNTSYVCHMGNYRSYRFTN